MRKTIIYLKLLSMLMTGSSIHCLAQEDSLLRASDDALIRDTIENQPYQEYKLNFSYLKTYPSDLAYVVSRPAHWQKKDWGKFSLAAVTTGSLLASDWEIRKIFQRNQSPFSNSVATVVEPFGNFYGLYLFPVMFVTGWAFKEPRIESAGLRGFKSLAISTVIYTAGKKLVRRKRPDEAASSLDYALPFTRKGYTSTPSGHANTIFTVATALALEFPEVKWVPVVAYSVATLTSVSRVYQNRHWASDVVVGALMGHFVTRAVYKANRKKKTIHSL